MAKIIVVIKAILTRIMFGTHGLIAIWRVTLMKNDPYYWYLTGSILALTFEGIFTLTIKKNQEWKWFCPSVFLYLCSVVPAIWLIEVDKFDKKLFDIQNKKANQAAGIVVAEKESKEELPGLDSLGVKIPVRIDPETWVTVIEQFLMLILIIGRWMLPKGGLTRDQLSQLLLVYIGTAADIIEFFDSFKDEKISENRILCLLILSIWSWSLLQFTFVLTATKARRTRLTTDVKETPKLKIVNGMIKVKEVCCNIDVWAILINIILQDAPFLIFRALLIFYFKIINYMNIFFTCKNTLVIILQFYRLYVVQQEKNKELNKIAKATVSKNVANAVESAARMGPQNGEGGRVRLVKNSSSNRRSGPSSRQAQNKNKHRSQDSISSQNTNRSASRRDRDRTGGRRRSISTGNLAEVGEGETFEDRIYEDDIELGMSGSAMSGTNDADTPDEAEESEVPLDEISVASERPRGPRKNIRMSDNPGIYKISGSRSSGGSSEPGHSRYRQDTGYSSSSKDSGNSGAGRRGRANNHGGRSTGRVSSRSRTSAQRRRQFISSKYCSSIEYGDIADILAPFGDSIQQESDLDNERLWQRRVAIGVVFFLFVVIFILCMVAIYGGINPKGLVLRENFRIRKTTRPTTTTPEPSTELVLTTQKPMLTGGDLPPYSLMPTASANDSLALDSNSTSFDNDTMDFAENVDSHNNKSSQDNNSLLTSSTVDDLVTVVTDDAITDDSDGKMRNISSSKPEVSIASITTLQPETSSDPGNTNYTSRRERLSSFKSKNNILRKTLFPRSSYHYLRHKMSRIFKFVSSNSFRDMSPFAFLRMRTKF